MKKCFKCLKVKNIDSFYRHQKMNDGHLNKCIDCFLDDSKANRLKNLGKYKDYDLFRVRYSLSRIFRVRYTAMRVRADGRGIHGSSSTGKTILDKQDFLTWCYALDNMKIFYQMYTTWHDSGFSRKLSPSIDRINNDEGYTLNNIQWLTLSDNSSKKRV